MARCIFVDFFSLTRTDNAAASTLDPKCSYSIRLNERGGPTVQRVNINDTIYHNWHCYDREWDSGLLELQTQK